MNDLESKALAENIVTHLERSEDMSRDERVKLVANILWNSTQEGTRKANDTYANAMRHAGADRGTVR